MIKNELLNNALNNKNVDIAIQNKDKSVKAFINEKVDSVMTEKEFVESQGIKYHRIPVMDYSAPTVQNVDDFLSFYKSLPKNAWIHAHCEAGVGRTTMFLSMIDMINNADMVGMMTSGKTMKALYWQLITRCEEKMMSWRPALEWMVKAILEIVEVYNIENLPKLDNFTVTVENKYPLQEDEDDEITLDLQKVNSQVMSKKSFMKKWMNATDEIAEEELKQIQLEKQMLEDSYAQFETNFEDEE